MTAPILDNDVSVDELREAVEHLHGVPARFVEAVEVDERFKASWRIYPLITGLGLIVEAEASPVVRRVAAEIVSKYGRGRGRG